MFGEFVEEQFLLFVALVVVVLMLIYSYVGDKLAGFKTVSADEAIRLYNDDAFVLDVRSSSEFKDGFIGEATNVAVGDLANNLNKLPSDKSKPILVYCLGGGRSARAAGTLVKNGYTEVSNLRGGITAWKAANLPLNKQKSKKSRKK